VAPQVIENKLKESPYIEQVMVVGENEKFVGALIIPAIPAVEDWCRQKGIATTNRGEMLLHPKVKTLFDAEVKRFNQEFGQVEQVKKYLLLNTEWTVPGGELTPTMKLKRKVIHERYRNDIAGMYH
jgi:long-chain acyl-CoA synthetase